MLLLSGADAHPACPSLRATETESDSLALFDVRSSEKRFLRRRPQQVPQRQQNQNENGHVPQERDVTITQQRCDQTQASAGPAEEGAPPPS